MTRAMSQFSERLDLSSSHSLKLWRKEYEEIGKLHKSYSSSSKYSDEQREAAAQYYIKHGLIAT